MILLQMFLTFFKIGLFTIGGGYAMLPLIQKEVEANGWVGAEDLMNFIAVSESTPGPFAINISTYVGAERGSTYTELANIIGSGLSGFIGAVCATLGVVLPSFIIILCVARFYEKFKTSKIVSGVMSGLKPAVIGLIGAAVINLGKTALFHTGFNLAAFSGPEIYISIAVAVIMTFLAFKKKHPILLICLSAIIGIIAGYSLGL